MPGVPKTTNDSRSFASLPQLLNCSYAERHAKALLALFGMV